MRFRDRVINSVSRSLVFAFDYFVFMPENLIKFLFSKKGYKSQTYFPNRKQKNSLKMTWEQAISIARNTQPNSYYFLYGLDVKTDEECKEYVEYRTFKKYRDKFNESIEDSAKSILRNKLYFGIFSEAIGVSTPKNIAFVNYPDFFMLQDKRHISLSDFLNETTGTFFCKIINGECGEGVFKLTLNDSEIQKNGTPITKEDFAALLKGKNYLIQENVTQNSKMSEMYSSSINTIRLVTVRNLKTNEIEVLPSMLRIGANGSVVDNTSQGGIAVGFDLSTGVLNETGFMKPQFGRCLTKHPNSGIVFSEFKIPYIDEVLRQAKFYHSMLDLHSIGWDIAIGENGPVFIEGNDDWEINGPQSCNHGFKKEFDKLFVNI